MYVYSVAPLIWIAQTPFHCGYYWKNDKWKKFWKKHQQNLQQSDSFAFTSNTNSCCNLHTYSKSKIVWYIYRYLLFGGVLEGKWNWMYYFIFIFRYITSFIIIIVIAGVFWTSTKYTINSNVINVDLISFLICALLITIPAISICVNTFHIRNCIVVTYTVTPDRTATELVMTGLGREINDLLLFSRNSDSTKIDINRKDVFDRSPVMFAANFNDVEGLRRLLKQGADFTQHGSARSPLTIAAMCNHTKCIQFLLDEVAGYDVNEIDPKGETSLTVTCYKIRFNGNQFATEAMLLLLDKYKVDVNSTNRFGQTPLMVACNQGHLEGVKILLSKYSDVIDINVRDKTGWTAFANATYHGHIDIMKLVMETNKLDMQGMNDAFVKGFGNRKSLDGALYLIKHENIDINVTDYDGFSALTSLTERGNQSGIELLLSEEYIDKINIYKKSKWGGTALTYAVFRSNIDVMKRLLDIDKSNSGGDNYNEENYVNDAFAYASHMIMAHFDKFKRNHEKIWDGMRYLISHCDIDVNYVYVHDDPKKRTTALISACATGLADEVKLLLSKYTDNIDMNIQDQNGKTAFMHAASKNHVEIVKLLLNAGDINIDAKDNDNATALMLAVFNSSIDVIKLLSIECKSEQLEIDAAFAYGARAKNDGGLDGMKYLIQNANANINSVDSYGDTAVINAARSNSEQVLKFLLSNEKEEIDVNFRNTTSNNSLPLTAVGFVSLGCDNPFEMMKLFVESNKLNRGSINDGFVMGFATCKGIENSKYLMQRYNIDINTTIHDHISALMVAIDHDNLDGIEMLLSDEYIDKIDVNATAKTGLSAFGYAVKEGNLKMINILLKTQKITHNEMNKILLNVGNSIGSIKKMDGMTYLIDELKVDMNVTDENGRTPLMNVIVTENENIEKLKFLLSTSDKLDVNVRDKQYGATGLHLAANLGKVEMVRLLLTAYDIDINIRNNDGYTPFMEAVRKNHVNVMKCLMNESREDIDIINEQNHQNTNMTSLMVASIHGSFEALKYILQQTNYESTYIHRKDLKHGLNALEFANQYHKTKCAECLKAYMC